MPSKASKFLHPQYLTGLLADSVNRVAKSRLECRKMDGTWQPLVVKKKESDDTREEDKEEEDEEEGDQEEGYKEEGNEEEGDDEEDGDDEEEGEDEAEWDVEKGDEEAEDA